VGCEERHWFVAPVVDAVAGGGLAVEVENGKKFHSVYAQVLEVWDLLDHPGVGSPQRRANI